MPTKTIILLHPDGDPITFMKVKQPINIDTVLTTKTNTWVVTEVSEDSVYKNCDLEVTVARTN